MLSFRSLSIRRKQMLIIMLTSTIVLFLACAAFSIYEVITFRNTMKHNLATLANIVDHNTAAALDYKDSASAEETLSALDGDPSIVGARLYTTNGQALATYDRRSDGIVFTPPAILSNGTVFQRDRLILCRPVVIKGEIIGTLYLESDMRGLSSTLKRYAGIVGLVFLLSLLVAFALSSRLQRLVSDPILQLARMTRSVALERNYSVRATKRSNDELGQLVDGFNEMLVQIQQRDAALQSASNELEARVIERTAELAKAIESLEVENKERRRAEETVRLSEEKFRQLADNITDVFWITSPDLKTMHYISAGYEHIWGRSTESLYAHPHQWVEAILPEEREHVFAVFATLMGNEAKVSVEYRIARPDGTVRLVHDRGFQVRDAAGILVRLTGIVTDITERKRAEDSLRESEERFQQLAANVTDVFYITSPDLQQMEYVSPAYEKIWGRSTESLYANPHQWGEAILPEEREVVIAAFSQLAAAEPSVMIEFRIARPDGTVRWILSQGFQVRDAAGKVIRITGTASDITERKKAQTELEDIHNQLVEASRLGGMAEIATNVLHNVGNVLNSVNVSAGLVVDGVKKSKTSSLAKVAELLREHEQDLGTFISSDPKGKQLPGYLAQLSEYLLAEQKATVDELQSLCGNIDHIKEIVTMQQSYARASGVTEIANITDLVEDSLRMNNTSLGQHKVNLIREFENVPRMNLEKHKILQILVNLVRNAKDACDESGRGDKRLTVRVANGDGLVRISVMDNGIGIPPENLTRIFNHGFTTRKDGHGFGLHSGALAAKEMGGSLTVQSDGMGKGATFTLALPCQPHEGDPSATGSSSLG